MRGIISIAVKHGRFALPPSGRNTIWYPIYIKKHRLILLHKHIYQLYGNYLKYFLVKYMRFLHFEEPDHVNPLNQEGLIMELTGTDNFYTRK